AARSMGHDGMNPLTDPLISPRGPSRSLVTRGDFVDGSAHWKIEGSTMFPSIDGMLFTMNCGKKLMSRSPPKRSSSRRTSRLASADGGRRGGRGAVSRVLSLASAGSELSEPAIDQPSGAYGPDAPASPSVRASVPLRDAW